MISKNKSFKYVCILLSTSVFCAYPSTTINKNYLKRSDSRFKYLQTVGDLDNLYVKESESIYGRAQVSLSHFSSFAPKDIAQSLFGSDCFIKKSDDFCGPYAIKIEGLSVANRDKSAWLADYFYLSRTYKGSFSIDPKIKTFASNFDSYLGLDSFLCGLYVRAYMPIVFTKWHLHFCDNPGSEDGGFVSHPQGYFSPGIYDKDLLLKTFEEFVGGGRPEKSTELAGTTGATGHGNDIGVQNSTMKFQSLKYGKMCKDQKKEVGLADFRAEVGFNIVKGDAHHIGFNLQFAVPTSSKNDPCFLFDAKIGNGGHFEVGGGLTTHYTMSVSKKTGSSVSLYLDANITHMFKTRVKRIFDLTGKPNSAYMLAAKFKNTNVPAVAAAAAPADGSLFFSSTTAVAVNTLPVFVSKQFAGEYCPVANLSTINVDVGVDVHADIVAQFSYQCGAFTWDLGYNLWAKSCESISCPTDCKSTLSLYDKNQLNTWALKGDARMFGFQETIAGPAFKNFSTTFVDFNASTIAIPLSSTESGATINSGTNGISNLVFHGNTDAAASALDVNTNIDSAKFAFGGNRVDPNAGRLTNIATSATVNQAHIKTSSAPIFLKSQDVELVESRGLTHTIFANMSYSFDMECFAPYVGIGASAEFGSGSSKNSETISCKKCSDCSLSQWGIWFTGGLAFS